MIHPIFEQFGAILGGLLTFAVLAVNILSLLRGRRIFRSHRSCRLNMM